MKKNVDNIKPAVKEIFKYVYEKLKNERTFDTFDEKWRPFESTDFSTVRQCYRMEFGVPPEYFDFLVWIELDFETEKITYHKKFIEHRTDGKYYWTPKEKITIFQRRKIDRIIKKIVWYHNKMFEFESLYGKIKGTPEYVQHYERYSKIFKAKIGLN